MFACHQSQVQWMDDNYQGLNMKDSFMDSINITSRYRGMQCGVKYAEGFIRCNDAYKMTAERLLP